MKTLKNLLYIFVIIGFFTSCDPNKELYQMLDEAKEPYHEDLTYTLKDEDYSTIKDLALAQAQNAEDSAKASAIATYKSFAEDRPAQDYIPLFLENTFLALDSASTAQVFYNYDYSYIFPTNYVLNRFQTDTFDQNTDFSFYAQLLDSIFPQPENGQMVLIFYVDSTDAEEPIHSVTFKYEDNAWNWHPDVYMLMKSDYQQMGNPGPGQYNNFSTDYPPENYLPTFLRLKYPYAQPGDAKELVYQYYADGIKSYHYTIYFFDGDTWTGKEVKSDKFLHNGEMWVYDPTIRFTMSCDDYQIIVDWIKNNDTLSGYLHPQYDNTEFYFGASSYYCNFDMRVYKRRDYDVNHYLDNLSDEEALQVLFDRLPMAIEIVLETKYPDATPLVNGVPLYAEVVFQTYEPGRYSYKATFKCVADGKFEYVEGSMTKLE